MARIFGRHMDCIREVLKDISHKHKDKKRFLDVGCGGGTRTILFNDFGRIVCGVDRHNWLNNEIKDRIQYIQRDFMRDNLPYENESFDLILSFDVIEHLYYPEVLLTVLHRQLAKDGILIIATPNRNRFLGFFLQLFGLRKFPYGAKENSRSDPYALHVIEYTCSELEKILIANGFKCTNRHKVFYGITGWYGITYFFSLPLFHNIILECKKDATNENYK